MCSLSVRSKLGSFPSHSGFMAADPQQSFKEEQCTEVRVRVIPNRSTSGKVGVLGCTVILSRPHRLNIENLYLSSKVEIVSPRYS